MFKKYPSVTRKIFLLLVFYSWPSSSIIATVGSIIPSCYISIFSGPSVVYATKVEPERYHEILLSLISRDTTDTKFYIRTGCVPQSKFTKNSDVPHLFN